MVFVYHKQNNLALKSSAEKPDFQLRYKIGKDESVLFVYPQRTDYTLYSVLETDYFRECSVSLEKIGGMVQPRRGIKLIVGILESQFFQQLSRSGVLRVVSGKKTGNSQFAERVANNGL